MRELLFLAALVFTGSLTAVGQDPVKVDPDHFKVIFENDQVRVLRSIIGPHEKNPMHEHPATVIISLTDVDGVHTLPDKKTKELHIKAGEARWSAPTRHAYENLTDNTSEAILVELKARPAKPQ
jgi:quercetin dioxygenase-like cupin family protein